MDLYVKPYRFRHTLMIIKLAVILHIFLSSEDVRAILQYCFRVKITGKTVCEWSKKFPEKIPAKRKQHKKNEKIILFADEKFIRIKSAKAYWWSVRDNLWNV